MSFCKFMFCKQRRYGLNLFLHSHNKKLIMQVGCFQMNFSVALPSLEPVKLPSKMETHIWYLLPDEVKNPTLLDEYVEILSPCEKENVFSMHEEHLRKQAILARALVRTTIARYQINRHVSPRSLMFKKNMYGKPEVNWPILDDWDPPMLNFNLSHTPSLIACGVTVNSFIGIDVEEKQRKLKSDILSFARRYFSPPEVEVLIAIPDLELRRQEFIKFWTLKEAYVKALGRGFSAAPFKTFTIRFSAPAKEVVHLPKKFGYEASQIYVESCDDSKLPTDCRFALLELDGSHYASICIENDTRIEDEDDVPLKLQTWKTIPFLKDEYIARTDTVLSIGGLVKQAKL